jgi:hydrophobic/amphiphilic exporter-1 (mainly G- bacteria), HAE1 family
MNPGGRMSLPGLAVQRPIATLMLLLCFMVVGGIAMARLPLAFLPNVDIPFIGIEIPYPNSNPTQIEKSITKPIEEALATLPGVKRLRSTSTADSAEFQIEFRWGHELDIVRMQVSEKLDQVKPTLPPGIGQIFIFSFNASDIPVVEARIAAEGVDLSQNYDLLETRVKNRLRRIPGVARVDLQGVAPREIYIDLILDRVKQHAVDVGSLIQKLQGASSNLVLGQVTQGGMRYTARALGAFDSLEAIQNLEVNERGLKLKDIAEITYEEPPIPFGRHLDGEYAVALNVFKESTANTVEVVQHVTKVIRDEIDKDPLLKGMKLFVWQDQAKAITDGIDGLKSSGYIGALLAVFVLYYFLRRIDSTFIVSLSIPFSVIATCGFLYFMGKTLNILSMCGLMLGVGMLVDDAIVVLESIDRRHRREKDPKVAAYVGARDVGMAVTCSTLTTVIVFLPLIVGGGTEIFTWLKEIGIAISISLALSLLSSLTLIPLMAAYLLRRRQTEPPKSLVRFEEGYVRTLAWTLRHKRWTFLIVTAGLVVGFVPFFTGLVDMTPFGAAINKRLFLKYEFSDFAYKGDAERAVNVVEAHFRAQKKRFGIESIYSYFTENDAMTVLTLLREDLSDRKIKDLRKEMRAGLPQVPGARIYFREDAEQGGGSTYFAVKFYGQDTAILTKFSAEAARRLDTVDGIEDISSSLGKGRNEIQVVVDRDKALRNGLTAEDVSQIFQFTLGGLRLRRFNAGDREVETWLELRREDRQNLDDLRKIQIGPPSRPILLGDIASFHVVRRAQQIEREDRKVRVAVNATYEGKDWNGTKKQVEGLMNAFDLPPGYTWSWDERILEQGEENKQWVVNIVLALVLVYIAMASLFESLAQPFAILFSIPFAMPGVTWLLAATRTPFNIMAWIGLLMLIGIVVKNGVVLLDHLNQLRQAGMAGDEAILEAGRDRLRPIVMTALTTTVGLIPLAFGRAAIAGGPYYFPLARTVMGGLISSTFLTLIVLPYINLGMEAAAAWGRRLWAASAPHPEPSPAPTTAPRTEPA